MTQATDVNTPETAGPMGRLIGTIELVAGLFLGMIGLLTVAEAGLRYGLGMRIPDAYLFATALQGCAIAWGIACTTWAKTHITVDVVWEMCSPRLRAGIDIFAATVTFAAFAVMAGQLWRKLGQTMASGEVSNDLILPVWPMVACTAAGIAATALLALLRLARDIQDFRSL